VNETGNLIFTPTDKRYPKMIVAEMLQEAYENVCMDGSNEFSLTLGWTIEKDYLKTTFFRARFINWTPF
jgi:hypothetical protein